MAEIITSPKYTIIEQVAVNCAAVWYEVGRSQGLTSKHKNARDYAKANLEKFIPKAVEICLEMLGPNSTLPDQAKMDIYEALMERHNDPTLTKYMPNFDVQKAMELAKQQQRPIDIAVDKAIQSLKDDTKKNKIMIGQDDFENTTSLKSPDIDILKELKDGKKE